ncbi:phage tail fiber protein [Prescottella agglutinans]|uniref:Minor tail protein n=1 Tax=Prescottella agglutinans TaxID=1644129 RepID=A0ABT6MFZ6_9NOCA|nr:hypothetical protein [Prescottella agglutinans]MDH6283242.1 hypothetical protein [Prescottella agglutinans]
MALDVANTREQLAIYLGTLGSWISLHTADPTTTGGSEASGSGYARVQTTWTGAAVDGTATGSAVTINVPPGTFAWAGVWSVGGTGGNFIAKIALNSTTLSAAGQIIVTPTLTIA